VTGAEVAALRGHESYIESAAFSAGTKVATASRDGTARVWDPKSGRQLALLAGHKGPVKSVAFSPDGTRLVTASDDNTVRIWEAATGRELGVLAGHDYSVDSAIYSADGSRILTSAFPQFVESTKGWTDGKPQVRLWNAVEMKEIAAFDVVWGREPAVFSPDGSQILIKSTSGGALIVDARSGQRLASLGKDRGEVQRATYSRDGARLVTSGGDFAVRVWDSKTGREITALRGNDDGTQLVALSPDARRVAKAGRRLQIYDSETGKEILSLRGGEAWFSFITFSPDGTQLAAGFNDGTVMVWDVRFATMDTDALVREVCERRLPPQAVLTRDEMRLAGYPDDRPPINVCSDEIKKPGWSALLRF
jgi:WD40 repeat protein